MKFSRPLTRDFYNRATADVARDLLGKILVHQNTAGRIVETEAYLGIDDGAAHASRGLTPATKVIFGPPGHAYVYMIYGMYDCLNFITESDGVPGGVLIRAIEPMEGLEEMRLRRPRASGINLANGPGKLTRAMNITRANNGVDVTKGELTVRESYGASRHEIAISPRIGITKCTDWPLRFFIRGNAYVSRAR